MVRILLFCLKLFQRQLILNFVNSKYEKEQTERGEGEGDNFLKKCFFYNLGHVSFFNRAGVVAGAVLQSPTSLINRPGVAGAVL